MFTDASRGHNEISVPGKTLMCTHLGTYNWLCNGGINSIKVCVIVLWLWMGCIHVVELKVDYAQIVSTIFAAHYGYGLVEFHFEWMIFPTKQYTLWETFHTLRWYILLNYITLQWRQNGRGSVSNHQPRDCFLNRWFRRRSKKTSKLCVTGLCAWNSPGTGEFPAQMASNAENVPFDDVIMKWRDGYYAQITYHACKCTTICQNWSWIPPILLSILWHIMACLQGYDQLIIRYGTVITC